MKQILIISKKMELGGTEVSLLNTINQLKKKNVGITLALLKKEGEYVKKIPKDIKVIEILNKNTIKYFEKINLKNITLKEKVKIILMKILKKISINTMYKIVLKGLERNKEYYDLAIDFHGYGYFGTVYLLEKVKAYKKVTFIHDEKIDWMSNVKNYIKKYDKIFCVSNSCLNKVAEKYKYLESKLDVFHNIIDVEKIKKMVDAKIDNLSNKVNLLTIGRLEYQKGYDLLINVAMKLDKSKYTWYIIGDGSLKEELQKAINENNLENNVILMGLKENPYPYIKKSDIYVQPSRHEGYGIAIAEARCLNKPIIATNLDCVKEQIKDGVTGILCEFDEQQFLNNINILIDNPDKRNMLSKNLEMQGFERKNDIKKLLEV